MSLRPNAVCEPHPDGLTTVWVEFPDAGVDRPRTYGLMVRRPYVDRLVRAINAGVATTDAHIAVDTNGQTYVAATPQVHTRYINVDLRRLGY